LSYHLPGNRVFRYNLPGNLLPRGVHPVFCRQPANFTQPHTRHGI